MGTEGGNIHVLDIATFQLSDTIIYQDVVTQKYVVGRPAGLSPDGMPGARTPSPLP